jgi:hypothetical protein
MTDDVNKLLELELQKWFKKVTNARELAHHLVGVEELRARAEQLRATPRATETVTREGVNKAVRVCDVLADADHLSADRSVAAPGLSQLRPDIVLTSDSGHYILIELKTMRASERQAVQELLAYSTSIKLQAPYLNDFMFIIVARRWDTLLEHATRALIMDGKHVLPLRVIELESSINAARKFELHIRRDLFEVNLVQFFDPWHALVPAEICVYRPHRSIEVDLYLRAVMRLAMYDAIKLHQTGFACFWTSPDHTRSMEFASGTLATVNQHWREGESLDGWYPRFSQAKQRGFHGLHQGPANRSRQPAKEAISPEDFLEQAFANEGASETYKQSTLSYELLERYRNRDREAELWRLTGTARDFEVSGTYFHLSMFMKEQFSRPMNIVRFTPFGELADFMRERYKHSPCDDRQLAELIDRFKDFKMQHPDALPDKWSDEALQSMRRERPEPF